MNHLRRELGVFSCTMLVAGNMIGVGIFVTPVFVYSLLPHSPLVILAWILGGLFSMCGAMAYSELSSRFPRAGGGYVFLREAFGPLPGFLSGFSSSVATIPGAIAFLAIGFTKYIGLDDPVSAKCLAIFLILVISAVNYRGVTWGSNLQDGFMVVKFAVIVILVAAGFFSGRGSMSHFEPLHSVDYLSFTGPLLLAMIPVMYTYSGWDASVYIAGEIKNPRRTIPISLILGTGLVTLIYLSLVILYIYALPIQGSSGEVKIVTLVTQALFGDNIARLTSIVIAISILGCLAASILTGPRILYAMALDGLVPARIQEVHPRFFTPGNAILFQAVWSCVLVLSGTFDQLLDYVTIPSLLFAVLSVIGLFVLRKNGRKDADAEPYLSWGYPVVPVIFIVGVFWMIAQSVLRSPMDSLRGLIVVSFGIPIYWIFTSSPSKKVP